MNCNKGVWYFSTKIWLRTSDFLDWVKPLNLAQWKHGAGRFNHVTPAVYMICILRQQRTPKRWTSHWNKKGIQHYGQMLSPLPSFHIPEFPWHVYMLNLHLRLRLQATSSNRQVSMPIECFRFNATTFSGTVCCVCMGPVLLKERYPLTNLPNSTEAECEFLNSGSLRLLVSAVILPYMGRNAFDALVTKTFGFVDGPFPAWKTHPLRASFGRFGLVPRSVQVVWWFEGTTLCCRW